MGDEGTSVLLAEGCGSGIGINAGSVGSGPALFLQQPNNGYAVEFASGGMRYNVTNVGTPGAISIRNTVYNVTTGGTFTFNNGTVNVNSLALAQRGTSTAAAPANGGAEA